MADNTNKNILQGDTTGLNRIQFDPTRFDKVLEIHGIRLKQYKTSICPNVRDLYSESHDINCPFCDNGVVAFDEVEFVGIFTTAKLDKIFKVEGEWLSGSAMLTAPAGIRFDYFDIIEVMDGTSKFSQLIKKSEVDIDLPKYKIESVLYLADSNKKQYFENADFVINDSGKIEWISSNRPEIGQIFTIAYEYRPRYRVIEHIHFTRDMLLDIQNNLREPTRMPQQVLCRLDFLVDTSKDPGND